MNGNADNLISGYTMENQHFCNMDETLAEAVRSFPCLYQKNLPEFKDKQKKEQAWISVAESTGLENGEEAKTLFSNLRTRYSRDKKRIKKKKVSGTSTDEVTKAKEETSELFPYLSWLDEYVQPRRSKSNFIVLDEEGNEDDSKEDSKGDVPSDSESCSSTREISTVTGRSKYKKRKTSKAETSDEALKTELSLLKSIGESLKNENPKEDKVKDEDELFCDLLSLQLKQLPDNCKIMVKMQINNMVYNQLLQMSSCNEQQSPSYFCPSSTNISTEPSTMLFQLRGN